MTADPARCPDTRAGHPCTLPAGHTGAHRCFCALTWPQPHLFQPSRQSVQICLCGRPHTDPSHVRP